MATLDKEIQILMLKGPKGDTGRSIESIVKTSSVGDTDTYTITYTDGTTTTFQVENGISQQELETALAPINLDISKLQQDKVNINWQSEEEPDESNTILNNPSGIQLSANGNDFWVKVLVQSHQVQLEASSENNTEEQLDYDTKLTLTDSDIIIYRDLGSGNVETASLFDLVGLKTEVESKHLYQHTIKLTYNLTNNSCSFTINLFTSTSTQFTSYASVRNKLVDGQKIVCTGFYRRRIQNGSDYEYYDLPIVELTFNENTLVIGDNSKFVARYYDYDGYSGIYNYSTVNCDADDFASITDTVTQIF